jgi:hypothetical protein
MVAGVGYGYGKGRYSCVALVGVVKGVGFGYVYRNAVIILLPSVGGAFAGRKRQDKDGKNAIG